MRHVANAAQKVQCDLSGGAKSLFPRQNMVISAPDDRGGGRKALQSCGEVKALHVIGEQDLRQIDLSGYDFVYAYLSSAAMPGLWEQARRQMRPGSLLISNSFAVPGVPAAATWSTDARDGSRLLLWRM